MEMRQAGGVCSVCQRQRTRGSRDDTGEIFICVDCQADAAQFIEIEQDLWGSTNETHHEMREVRDEQHPDNP